MDIDKIYFEIQGGSKDEIWVKVYTNPKEGHGTAFDLLGNPHTFAWVHPEKSMDFKPSELPEDFVYSFMHGESLVIVKDKDISDTSAIITIEDILSGEWTRVTPETVERAKRVTDIKFLTKEDVIKNKDEFEFFDFSIDQCEQLLNLIGAPIPQEVNGELGFWEYKMRMYGRLAFETILKESIN